MPDTVGEVKTSEVSQKLSEDLMVSLNCEVWNKGFVMKSFANKLPKNIIEEGVLLRSQQETEGISTVGSSAELTGRITYRRGGQDLGDWRAVGAPGQQRGIPDLARACGGGELGSQSAGRLCRSAVSALFTDPFLGGMGLSFSSLFPQTNLVWCLVNSVCP